MAEYINKKTAISLIKQYGHDAIDGGRYSLGTVDDCIELANCIEALPAADVAPVVRCKDCKHFKNYGKTSLLIDGKNIKAGWCHRRARYDEEYRMPPDGFCSYGERKNGGDNNGESVD